jgi:hypothetical protein
VKVFLLRSAVVLLAAALAVDPSNTASLGDFFHTKADMPCAARVPSQFVQTEAVIPPVERVLHPFGKPHDVPLLKRMGAGIAGLAVRGLAQTTNGTSSLLAGGVLAVFGGYELIGLLALCHFTALACLTPVMWTGLSMLALGGIMMTAFFIREGPPLLFWLVERLHRTPSWLHYLDGKIPYREFKIPLPALLACGYALILFSMNLPLPLFPAYAINYLGKGILAFAFVSATLARDRDVLQLAKKHRYAWLLGGLALIEIYGRFSGVTMQQPFWKDFFSITADLVCWIAWPSFVLGLMGFMIAKPDRFVQGLIARVNRMRARKEELSRRRSGNHGRSWRWERPVIALFLIGLVLFDSGVSEIHSACFTPVKAVQSYVLRQSAQKIKTASLHHPMTTPTETMPVLYRLRKPDLPMEEQNAFVVLWTRDHLNNTREGIAAWKKEFDVMPFSEQRIVIAAMKEFVGHEQRIGRNDLRARAAVALLKVSFIKSLSGIMNDKKLPFDLRHDLLGFFGALLRYRDGFEADQRFEGRFPASNRELLETPIRYEAYEALRLRQDSELAAAAKTMATGCPDYSGGITSEEDLSLILWNSRTPDEFRKTLESWRRLADPKTGTIFSSQEREAVANMRAILSPYKSYIENSARDYDVPPDHLALILAINVVMKNYGKTYSINDGALVSRDWFPSRAHDIEFQIVSRMPDVIRNIRLPDYWDGFAAGILGGAYPTQGVMAIRSKRVRELQPWKKRFGIDVSDWSERKINLYLMNPGLNIEAMAALLRYQIDQTLQRKPAWWQYGLKNPLKTYGYNSSFLTGYNPLVDPGWAPGLFLSDLGQPDPDMTCDGKRGNGVFETDYWYTNTGVATPELYRLVVLSHLFSSVSNAQGEPAGSLSGGRQPGPGARRVRGSA